MHTFSDLAIAHVKPFEKLFVLKSLDIFEVVGTGFYMVTREFNFAQIHFDAISK